MDISSRVVPKLPLLSRVTTLLLTLALITATLGSVPAAAQSACRDQDEETYEKYGPTDVTAVSGNQRMAAAVNDEGTVTVLKWPSPSYYDQIKYRTTDRTEPRMGALPNEGAFIGIGFKRGTKAWRFDWLRDWSSHQRFADDDGDEVVTTFRNRSQGLTVTVRDVVAHDQDTLSRIVGIKRSASSRVTRARVISFANFNPVHSKAPRSPTDDWCTEEDNDDGATYDRQVDAIIHERTGTDVSTGEPSGAALAMGFSGTSAGHHIGLDTYETGSGEGSAYDDAKDARLTGSNDATGQVDTAISDDLSLARRRSGTIVVHISAGFSAGEAVSNLKEMRGRSAGEIRQGKQRWWTRWLRGSRIPKGAPAGVVRLAKRSLISARQAADPRGLIVASIATQPPHGVDWIRNGAYINRMLDLAGYREMVSKHNVRYAELQATAVSKPVGGETTPSGNWAQNYYADGVVGGPIPYEIDETGLGIWTLWDHFGFSGERTYLLSVYEAIQRAAHYLSDNAPLGCRDPATGLQCAASEGDNAQATQTLVGAQAVWLGLDAAVQAARELGTETSKQNAAKWAARRDELKTAIDDRFLDEDCSCYTRDYQVGGTNLWPVGLSGYGSKISDAQASVNWRHMARVLGGKESRGEFESRMLVGNAYAWQKQPAKRAQLERALKWVAAVPTTDTGVLGEAWMRFPSENGPVVTMNGQPDVWNQAMFYVAAIKVYGSARWSP